MKCLQGDLLPMIIVILILGCTQVDTQEGETNSGIAGAEEKPACIPSPEKKCPFHWGRRMAEIGLRRRDVNKREDGEGKEDAFF